MPLLDHFHAPLYPLRSWESFHSRWANCIADGLQRILPRRYFAEVQIHLGTSVEADVAEFESTDAEQPESGNGSAEDGGVAVAVQPWAPPAPPVVVAATFTDETAVEVRDERDNARLVAVVELVSPRNKDRPAARRDFAIKCAAYLQRGIGVVVADVVTGRHANLHNELARLLSFGDAALMPDEAFLYAVAYRPARRGDENVFDIWPTPLTVGGSLPTLPLALRGSRAVPVDLEAAYAEARQRSRL